MTRRLRRLAAAVFAAVVFAPLWLLAEAPDWPPASDLPQDPEVVSGRLANGLRYAVRPNHEPRGRTSVRLLVRAGSLDETEDERGLAHYLEHMAFNGTRHFPADTLAEYFQRHGMSFGGDSNAHTGFEQTVYLLELPRSDAATLQEGLDVLRDFADGMLIDEAEVEKERGIIFAEKRARDSVEFRTMLAEYRFILPDTLPPQRFPIGEAETLQTADATRLREFYRRWYRPDNLAVVVVGEADPAGAVKLIEATFAPLAAGGALAARQPLGTISPASEPLALVHREPEASSVTVALDVTQPYSHEPDTAATRLKNLPRDVAFAMLNRRLDRLARRENAPFNTGGASAAEVFDFARIASLELTGPPARWRESLAIAEQELRRALEHGFAPGELHEISAGILNAYEEAVLAAPTRRSSALADALTYAIDDDEVFTTPETELELVRPAVEKLTLDACLRALRDVWAGSALRIFVSGKLADSDTAGAVLAEFRASRDVAVAAPEAPKDDAFAYTDFGPAGAIASREHVDDLDLTLVRFANGVRLNLKRTEFRANSVSLRARLGGGQLEVPRDRPELATIAGALLTEGGLGRHDVDDLRRLLAGRTVSVSFGVGDDAFEFSGGASTKDLELSLQLLCAYLVDPGWRPDALAQTRRIIEQSYQRMLHTLAGVAQLRVPLLLASGDPRFGLPPLEKLLAVSADEVRAWMAPILASGALEVSLVGDLDVEKTIELAARTLGALPPRAPKPDFAGARQVRFPAPPPAETYSVETEILKSLVLVYWPTTDSSDIHRVRRLSLLASVVEDRLRRVIREELGAAYSPSAASSQSDAFPGYGNLSTRVEVDPAQATTVQEMLLRIGAELRAGGVTDDELQRAKEPRLTALRDTVRDNRYWIGSVLGRAQEKPEVLDYARSLSPDYAAIAKPELDALAAEYFDNARAARFIIRPAQSMAPVARAAGTD